MHWIPRWAIAALLLVPTSGCQTLPREQEAQQEIASHYRAIRSDLARNSPDALLRLATFDWRYLGLEGDALTPEDYRSKVVERARYLGQVLSCEVYIESISVNGNTAEARLQITTRFAGHDGGSPPAQTLRQWERHAWVRTGSGWRLLRCSPGRPPEILPETTKA